MRNFVLGTVFGLVIATVGFSGLARMFDKGVYTIQQTSKELAQ
jgi:hypothetical protein